MSGYEGKTKSHGSVGGCVDLNLRKEGCVVMLSKQIVSALENEHNSARESDDRWYVLPRIRNL